MSEALVQSWVAADFSQFSENIPEPFHVQFLSLFSSEPCSSLFVIVCMVFVVVVIRDVCVCVCVFVLYIYVKRVALLVSKFLSLLKYIRVLLRFHEP